MSVKTIYVNPPVNLGRKNCLYSKRSYDIRSLKVLFINDVDVTYDGVCFRNSKIIKECIQAYPEKIKIFELQSQLQFRLSPIIHYNDNNQYLLIHHPWLNYYHWLTEAIPRLWLVKDILDSMVLLLPQHYKDFEFIQASLEPFDIKKIIYLPSGFNARIRNAVIPQIKPICSTYNPSILLDLRNFFIDYAKQKGVKIPELGEKIYIIRGNSSRRKILNEEELIRILKNYNFKSIEAATFSFYEQVLFSEKLKYLISNGSGLTNMHFMKAGTTVMELQKKITNENDFHDVVLWHFASALNLDYWFFVCMPVNKNDDMYSADLKIDLKRFEFTIRKMLQNYFNQ